MSIIINNPSSVNDIANGSVTTAKLADGAVTTAKLSTSLANINYFKNPAFSVIQGSASGTITGSTSVPTASLGYPGETEWSISNNNDFINYSFSGQTLTFTHISGRDATILQRIESVDTARLAGKTVTVSVEVAPSFAEGKVQIQLYRPTTTADTHGTLASSTQTLISDSGQISLTSVTSTRYSHTVTLPTTVNLGLEVRFRLSGGGSTVNIAFARPKLEEGSTATAFTCDDVAVELTKCQRYFMKLSGDFYIYAATAGSGLNQSLSHSSMFGTNRTRTLIATNLYSNTNSLTASAGVDQDSTRITITSTAGGYFGGRPQLTVAAHIP